MSTERFIVTPPPHLKEKVTVQSAMRDVWIALIPIGLTALYFYRLNALLLVLVCLATAAITDVAVRAALHKPHSLKDGSALLTGYLVALCFSPTASWFLAVVATFMGVGVAKELMGGLGWNRFNPALFGRVSVIVLGSVLMLVNPIAGWAVRFPMVDIVSGATPMALLKQGLPIDWVSLFFAYPRRCSRRNLSPGTHPGWHLSVLQGPYRLEDPRFDRCDGVRSHSHIRQEPAASRVGRRASPRRHLHGNRLGHKPGHR